ncbi:MAG: hypothetical protein HKP31_00525 [Nitrosopumilus sp.]|nr:hypothetical protein [Nitrosopumilus sp.]
MMGISSIKNFMENQSKGNKNDLKPLILDGEREEEFSKNIFYACGICEGPLVPVSSCAFCKRTSLRRCNKCKRVKDIQTHESCKILVCFGWEIAKKHSQVGNF